MYAYTRVNNIKNYMLRVCVNYVILVLVLYLWNPLQQKGFCKSQKVLCTHDACMHIVTTRYICTVYVTVLLL